MSPLMLVNWHVVNLRFRALMWMLAIAIALVIAVSSMPTEQRAQRASRAPATAHAALDRRP